MRPLFYHLCALGACLSLGCASVKSFSLTQVPADRSRPIQAQADDWSFLGINFSNDFVSEIQPKLLEQCPHGDVRGVLTKQESTLWILFLNREITATAYCVSPQRAEARSAEPAAPVEPSEPAEPAAPAAATEGG